MCNNLFKFLEKKGEKESLVKEDMKEIVERHIAEFYKTDEKALMMSGAEVEVIEKQRILEQYGFKNFGGVFLEVSQKLSRLAQRKRDGDCLEYFSEKYPSYRIISEEVLSKICEDFDSLYYPVNKIFISNCHDSTIKDLEKVVVSAEDECYYIKRELSDGTSDVDTSLILSLEEYKKYLVSPPVSTYVEPPCTNLNYIHVIGVSVIKDSLYVIFEKVLGRGCILKPVQFRGVRYYIVVTYIGDYF